MRDHMRPECGSSAPRWGCASPPARGVGLPAHGTGARVTPSCPAGTRVLSCFFSFSFKSRTRSEVDQVCLFFSVRLAKRLRGFPPSRPSSRSRVIRHRGVFTLPGSARRGFTGLCVSARGRESSRPRSPHGASVWRWGQESPAPRPPLPRIRPPAERPGRTVLSVMIVGRLLRASSILEVQRYSGSSPDLPQTWQRVSFLEFTRARPPGRPE